MLHDAILWLSGLLIGVALSALMSRRSRKYPSRNSSEQADEGNELGPMACGKCESCSRAIEEEVHNIGRPMTDEAAIEILERRVLGQSARELSDVPTSDARPKGDA
jgi:hypothetical protein